MCEQEMWAGESQQLVTVSKGKKTNVWKVYRSWKMKGGCGTRSKEIPASLRKGAARDILWGNGDERGEKLPVLYMGGRICERSHLEAKDLGVRWE